MSRMEQGDPAIDLVAETTIQDPYPTYDRLCAQSEIYFCPRMQTWHLAQYADVLAGFRDHRFSADRSKGSVRTLVDPLKETLKPLDRNLGSWALMMDPPDHTRIRGLINKAFTPKAVERVRPRTAGLVKELLDAVPAGEALDIVQDLAIPLPVIIIGELLGLPREDGRLLKKWSGDLEAFLGASARTKDTIARGLHGIGEMESYFRRIIEKKRAHPEADLLSELIHAHENEAMLSDQELISTCSMLLFVGHETTTNLIASGVYLLLAQKGAWTQLQTSPEALPSAIEEILRYESPIQRIGRVALEDIEIRETTIPKGDRVFLLMGAAHRDPTQFPEPNRFDMMRADNRHLAFGAGTHFCVGAALARMEGQLAFSELLSHYPRMSLLEAPKWKPSIAIRALTSLPVSRGV